MARKKSTRKGDQKTEENRPAAPREVNLRLEGDLTIRDVAARRDEWKALLDGASLLVVDAGSVERVDSAGLQLLVALKESAKRRDLECRVVQPSATLSDAIATVGLGPCLGIDAPGSK